MMDNVEMEMEDENTLVIRIDLSLRGGRSPSGKTIRIASTEGNAPLPQEANLPNARIGLNVYTYPEN
jgi:hypothetical protein